MPKEILENPQPVQPTESKSKDWTKIVLAAVVGLGILAASAYAGYYYGTQQVQPVEKPTPVVSQPTPTPTPKPTPVVEDETERVRGFLVDYMNAVASEDWDNVRKYLTKSVRGDFMETAAPSGIEDYEILSITGPDDGGRYLAVVRCYDSGGRVMENPMGDPRLLVVREDGQWKTLTWYLYQ